MLLVWKEFIQKKDVEEHIVVLTLRYLLGFEINVISAGLDVPEGTVLHRIGRGLEDFGQFEASRKRSST
jgi:DNA-directed RNA polymerase specialized sigma24 family protein